MHNRKINIYRWLGLLLTRYDEKGAKDLGETLWNNRNVEEKQVSLETSLIIYDCSLGRSTYTKQRKLLKSSGFDILPPWSKLNIERKSVTPNITQLPEPHIGIFSPLFDAVKITAERIILNLPLQIDITAELGSLKMDMKFGFDGSGSHAIYNQVNVFSSNINMSMFCPLSIVDESGNDVWTQKSTNAPLSQRPVCLQMGKDATLQSLTVFNDDIPKLLNEGFNVTKQDVTLQMKVNIKYYMLDMKAHLYLGLGGAYCDLCHLSKNLFTTCDELVQEDGVILKRAGDYDTRAGVTAKPIATNSVLSVQVLLHAILHSFDHFLKTAVHVKAHVFDWTESPSSRNM